MCLPSAQRLGWISRTTDFRLFIVAWAILFSPAVFSQSSQDVAEYYYRRYDYATALDLWSELHARRPTFSKALLRVGELKFLLEGRSVFRDFVWRSMRKPRGRHLDHRERLKAHILQLQSLFLTDDSQKYYLQAMSFIKKGQCREAIPLLNQAHAIEAGNIKVLHEKAQCEKKMRAWVPFSETSQIALENNPLDPQIIENWMETRLYLGKYRKIQDVHKEIQFPIQTNLAQTAWAVSQWKLGKTSRALFLFNRLLGKSKRESVHPIVYFGAGSILAQNPQRFEEGITYLQHFLSLAVRNKNTDAGKWDPYKTESLIPRADALIEDARKFSFLRRKGRGF